MLGKQFIDLTKAGVLKDSDIFAVHDGNGLKQSSMGDVTAYMSDKFSNPNLLINPDFKINQRGATNYESDSSASVNMYSVDRWSLYRHKLTVNSDKSITVANTPSSEGTFSQILEDAVEGNVTIQIYVVDVSDSASVLVMTPDGKTVVDVGNLKKGLNVFHYQYGLKKIYIKVLNGTITLKYAKVEQGTVATPFIAPNRAEEFVKCCRFFQTLQVLYSAYCVTEQHYYQKLPLVTALRVNPTVSVTDQYNYNVKSKKLEWRNDGGTGWLNLDLVATNSSQTVCQMICTCDAEIY